MALPERLLGGDDRLVVRAQPFGLGGKACLFGGAEESFRAGALPGAPLLEPVGAQMDITHKQTCKLRRQLPQAFLAGAGVGQMGGELLNQGKIAIAARGKSGKQPPLHCRLRQRRLAGQHGIIADAFYQRPGIAAKKLRIKQGGDAKTVGQAVIKIVAHGHGGHDDRAARKYAALRTLHGAGKGVKEDGGVGGLEEGEHG